MNCASSRTSPCEKFSSSGHFGISAWMRCAKRMASPWYSRPASSRAGSPMCPALCTELFSALPHCLSEAREQRGRIAPPETGIGDALPELEPLAGLELLAAFDQVRFDHRADDAPLAGGDLRADVACDVHLALVLLGGVGVRAVDHQPLLELRPGELLAGGRDARRVVVRALAAAQDDVAIVVAARLHDRDLPALVHRKEMVLLPRREQRVDRDLDVAVGAVLEAHRRGQPGGELAVHMAHGGARPDGAPGHEVTDVLR